MNHTDRAWLFPSTVPKEARLDAAALADGTNDFAAALYHEFTAAGGNVFFSPASIAFVLAMAYAGARGETAAEIAVALSILPLPNDRLHAALAALGSMANDAPGVEFNVANAIFGHRGEAWLPGFLTLLDDCYGAPLRELELARDPGQAVQAINHWVRQQTKGMIEQLVSPGDLDSRSRLVLVNAAHFQGLWATPFDAEDTLSAPFQLTDGGSRSVQLMHQESDYRLIEELDLQIIDLPYESSPISMVAVLPRDQRGLAAVESRFRAELPRWLERLDRESSREVEVYIPRFRVDGGLSCRAALKALGIRLAFSEGTSDFSGMNGRSGDLFVNAVSHRAVVEVDETGTVAAAASAGLMREFSTPLRPPPPTPIFRADRPFLFLIRDVRTNNILFLGRLLDPEA